jgi:hypothetical protein
MGITILGPQRRPTVDQVENPSRPEAPLAMVTAGWEEREPDDGELRSLLGGPSENLGLYGRWRHVQDNDREFAVAELEHRAVVEELQQLYMVQLDYALRSTYAVAQRGGDRPRAHAAALADAQEIVRHIDANHLARVREVNGNFDEAWRPHERELVAHHRGEVRDVLQRASGLVVAWSAGAMVLTERVVLFHDRVPEGPAHAEVYDAGLGVIRGMVLLPHARRRLRVDDLTRMRVMARRFAPAACVVLDDGVRVDLTDDGRLPAGARVIAEDGRILAREAA